MNFAAPEHLVYLWLIPVAVFVYAFAHRRRVARLRRIAGVSGTALSSAIATGRTLFKGVLLTLALVFVVVALARPRWGFEWQNVRTTGADVIIAVDVSNSMLAAPFMFSVYS